MNNKSNYQFEFSDFLKLYHSTEMDAEAVGAMMMRLAQIFAEYNMKMVAASHDLAVVAEGIAGREDANGKQITSAKAETFVAATDEADKYNTLKAHVQNIEQYISATRALQKGMMNEYSVMKNT